MPILLWDLLPVATASLDGTPSGGQPIAPLVWQAPCPWEEASIVPPVPQAPMQALPDLPLVCPVWLEGTVTTALLFALVALVVNTLLGFLRRAPHAQQGRMLVKHQVLVLCVLLEHTV